jgi:hypothetical protein
MRNRYHSRRQRKPMEFLMPFLILISIGLIVVLVLNLWKAIFTSDPGDAAYMHIVSGSAQIKTWGTEEFFDLRSDALVMQGDRLQTTANGQIIIEFFEGTIMRISPGSDVIFDLIEDDDGEAQIEVTLVEGDLWFNRLYKDRVETSVVVLADNIRVKVDSASILNVSNGIDQSVEVLRVFPDGDGATVDVLNKEGDSVVETEQVDLGQEVVFTKKILESYWGLKSPTVLSVLSDDFKQSPWYEYNIVEDKAPTEFEKYAGPDNLGLIKVDPESISGSADLDADVVDPEVEEEVGEDDSSEEEEAEVVETAGPLAKPSISSVGGVSAPDDNGFYQINTNVGTLLGSISGAAKVVVNGYTLTKFSAGDSSWTYYANADYGLMVEGENTYEVYAEDVDGNKSESIVVKVFYTAPVAEPVVEPVVEEPPVAEVEEEAEPVADEAADPVDVPAEEEVL